jgi:hypothetical protein
MHALPILTFWVLVLAGCQSPTEPPRPAILRGLTASGGLGEACPAQPGDRFGGLRMSMSPELDARIREQFPLGTEAVRLIDFLTAQGFKLAGECPTDPTIQRAEYFLRSEGFLRFASSAAVYWKTDDQNRIVWTRGFFSVYGL